MDYSDRAWIVSRNHISQEYTLGLNNFLATTRRHLGLDGRTLCPCNRCENTWLQQLPMIRAHILRYGMLATYQRWIHHGESLSDEEEHDHFEDSSNNDEDDHILRDAIMDEEGHMFFNVDRSTENDIEDKSDVNCDSVTTIPVSTSEPQPLVRPIDSTAIPERSDFLLLFPDEPKTTQTPKESVVVDVSQSGDSPTIKDQTSPLISVRTESEPIISRTELESLRSN
ncbi:hypothetical protein Ccrd_020023 [Cynara cardunculus var. scolymus]|uniref:Transposase-associated domain-containing protein n=1 Tax=Cynara cardunculus var. scolymus TaxID=59895 RepID=A0A118K0P3_CYNCS|nr:hypothetical protein Ccrd_020023 [Cynara cardunculus var. scolymus]